MNVPDARSDLAETYRRDGVVAVRGVLGTAELADLADAVGILDLPDVAGVAEVVHDQVGVHDHPFT